MSRTIIEQQDTRRAAWTKQNNMNEELYERYGVSVKNRTNVGATNYNPSILTTDHVIVVDNSAAPRSVIISTEDIASASGSRVREFIVPDEQQSAGTNNITVTLENGGTINGASSYVISGNGDSLSFYVDGNNGFKI